jgi:NAD-dependent SIR2 family protein deacetylase
MKFRKDEIIFLLGAGASVEADIPASRGDESNNWRQTIRYRLGMAEI